MPAAEGRGHGAVIPRRRSVPRAGLVAHAGCRLEDLERVDAGRVSVCEWDLSTARDSELRSENVSMCLSGPRRNSELSCDLNVRASSGDQVDYLALPLSEMDVLDGRHEPDVGTRLSGPLLAGRCIC